MYFIYDHKVFSALSSVAFKGPNIQVVWKEIGSHCGVFLSGDPCLDDVLYFESRLEAIAFIVVCERFGLETVCLGVYDIDEFVF